MVNFNDRLPYLCPTIFIGLATPLYTKSCIGSLCSFPMCMHSLCEKHCFFTIDLLSTKDLRTLLSVLHGVTTQWEFIGLALGFDPEDLKIIEQTPTLIPKGPVAYLKEMLHQWLKWCPPNHDRPTISFLCEALRNPIVGNEHLANTLKDQLKAIRGITVLYMLHVYSFFEGFPCISNQHQYLCVSYLILVVSLCIT